MPCLKKLSEQRSLANHRHRPRKVGACRAFEPHRMGHLNHIACLILTNGALATQELDLCLHCVLSAELIAESDCE